jgi:2,4-dienoyl-CoA reductase-like NADH-dependent reductase (Old Yellow Enzyme family)
MSQTSYLTAATSLFEPLRVGALTLPNRVVMSPLTRSRASADLAGERIPNDLMRQYYVQRASAGLIISEATAVTPMGVGYADTPGIWSQEQVAGWRKITDAVHEAGGRIVLQLWHVGRISHPDFLNGELPVAPSAIAPTDLVRTPSGKKPYVTPRALEREEIPGIIEAFKLGARNALDAGFDGVEIHGANGYLLDQFLRDGANHRTDDYGCSLENRARLLLEVTDAVIEVWGASRVGVHLSPRNSEYHSMHDSDTLNTFSYVVRELGKRKIAFIAVRESLPSQVAGARAEPESDLHHSPVMKREFQNAGGGAFIANEGFTKESAEDVLASGEADAVAWGRDFLANPDLPRRLELNAPLNEPNMATFYAPGAEGYVDYPFLNEK